MHISAPKIGLHSPNEIQISAIISGYSKPRVLWFRFPRRWENSLFASSDAFLTAMILPAMAQGQPLSIEGQVSKKLLKGLHQYQAVFAKWYPHRFSVVEMCPDQVTDERYGGEWEATAFSGGVDSFYSWVTLKKQLHGALFMAGFDMPLNLKRSIGELTASFEGLSEESKIPLSVGSTNLREFTDTVDWTNAHGPALAASALFFQKVWRKFYIPSSYTEETYPKWGTHPELDPLLSTESMEFVHHGMEANRVRKLERLVLCPETYDRLRVCWIQDIGLKNCGKCEKCIRTQIALGLLKALPRYSTFPSPLTGRKIRSLAMRTHQSRLFARELIDESLKRRSFLYAGNLTYALLRRRVRRWAHSIPLLTFAQ